MQRGTPGRKFDTPDQKCAEYYNWDRVLTYANKHAYEKNYVRDCVPINGINILCCWVYHVVRVYNPKKCKCC